MNDEQTQDIVPPQDAPQSSEAPTVEPSIPPTDTTPIDIPPIAPESPREAPTPVPVEDQNGVVNQENSPATVPTPSFLHDLLLRARAKIQDRKRKKLDRIMDKLTIKSKISNDDVQKLLYVSDATATRYLTILEKEGKIQQAGRTGKSVFYTKI